MAQRCEGCPLRCRCYKGREERRIITAHHLLRRYKNKAAELLTSEEGIKHRKRRCIEPESRFRTNKEQHGVPPLPPLRQRQGHNGLCLLSHCLQSQENVLHNGQTGKKRGKCALFCACFLLFLPDSTLRESHILEKLQKRRRLKPSNSQNTQKEDVSRKIEL